MPRRNPYRIVLSRAEARELSRPAMKYTLAYYQVDLAKRIVLAADGWVNDDIGSRLYSRREERLLAFQATTKRLHNYLGGNLHAVILPRSSAR